MNIQTQTIHYHKHVKIEILILNEKNATKINR